MRRYPPSAFRVGSPSFRSANSQTWRAASSTRLLGWSSRKLRPISNITVGSQALVLSFLPIFLGPVCDPPHRGREQRPSHALPRFRSHWPAEHLPSRCTITAITTPFHLPGLSTRGYKSLVSPPTAQRTSSGAAGKKDNTPPPPQRSALHPPKQAPSVWQIFFTDWLQNQKSHEIGRQKLNVAQEAKEAGHAYNKLSDEEKEALKHRATALKERYEREFTAWLRSLTPADIERENAFRKAQRKSGKSRRKNINDPNAPKRPLSAYFLFLQTIRADPHMVRDVFGDATEPTRQSVLAAAKWRSMSDVEKQPYLAQAENARLEYEVVRKAYEERIRSLDESSVFFYPNSTPDSPHEGTDRFPDSLTASHK